MTRLTRPALLTAALLLAIYSATLAPTVTYWDAGEFLAAIRTLGVPHPPGTPLYILIGRVWSYLLQPLVGFTVAVNLLSAVATATALGVVAALLHRATDDPWTALAGALCAGVMSTVWLNATETEVYALALLAACVILWSADGAGRAGELRWAMLTAYLMGLAWSLHLAALVVAPAALYLLFTDRAGRAAWPRLASGASRARGDTSRAQPAQHSTASTLWPVPLLLLLGASAVLFMLVRARHDPAINQGNPATWGAMWDAVNRRQYAVAPLWPRSAPLWLQLGNLVEYADWQVAQGLAPDAPPSRLRTPVTLLFAAAAVAGSLAHRRRDARSWRALLIVLLTATAGLVVYLNLRAGPSFGAGVLPAGAAHEARERDYFFVLGFVVWGVWAGYGLVVLSRRLFHAPWPGLAVAALPALLNWTAVDRALGPDARRAEREALAMLRSAPRNAVFLALGDNDTYPLWYLQQVHGVRRDVVVVTIPMLGASWYRQELARRYRLLDSARVGQWHGAEYELAELREHALAQLRPVVESPYARGATPR